MTMDDHLSLSADITSHRLVDIQEMADTVSVGGLLLNRLVKRLGWEKSLISKSSKVGYKRCPYNESHFVKEERVQEHATICCARKGGLPTFTKHDILPSSWYCYKHCKSVVPVYLGSEQYEMVDCKLEGDFVDSNHSQLGPAGETLDDAMASINTSSATSLHETNDEINQYIPTDPLDHLRFIYSWTAVPRNFLKVNVEKLNPIQVKTWMLENLPKQNLKLSLGADVQVTDMVYNWLCDPAVAQPDSMKACLREIYGEDAGPFVLLLWKFLASTILCLEEHIPENTRKEFEFYSMAMSLSKSSCESSEVSLVKERVSSSGESVSANKESGIYLPMEWVSGNVTREKRLALYEHVVKMGKLLVPSSSVSCDDVMSNLLKQTATLDAASSSTNSDHQSQLELMAALRNYKRRRQAYRGKNAAGKNKPTRIGVLREQVEQHMTYLALCQDMPSRESHSAAEKPLRPDLLPSGENQSPKVESDEIVIKKEESLDSGDKKELFDRSSSPRLQSRYGRSRQSRKSASDHRVNRCDQKRRSRSRSRDEHGRSRHHREHNTSRPEYSSNFDQSYVSNVTYYDTPSDEEES